MRGNAAARMTAGLAAGLAAVLPAGTARAGTGTAPANTALVNTAGGTCLTYRGFHTAVLMSDCAVGGDGDAVPGQRWRRVEVAPGSEEIRDVDGSCLDAYSAFTTAACDPGDSAVLWSVRAATAGSVTPFPFNGASNGYDLGVTPASYPRPAVMFRTEWQVPAMAEWRFTPLAPARG